MIQTCNVRVSVIRLSRIKFVILSAIFLMAISWRTAVGVPAFPGAQGFGAETPGGRGGDVVVVDTLEDRVDGSLVGSLRAAINADRLIDLETLTYMPRTIVFAVSGTIKLESGLEINQPFLTIAGQTAPGDGITLKTVPPYKGPALSVASHDIVIRFLRIRLGAAGDDGSDLGCCGDSIGVHSIEVPDYSVDGLVHDVIIDHCSFSWSTDENASSWYGASNITYQWNIISEGLADFTDINGDTVRGKGMLIGQGPDPGYSKDISIHHNLFAHNVQRNPLCQSLAWG